MFGTLTIDISFVGSEKIGERKPTRVCVCTLLWDIIRWHWFRLLRFDELDPVDNTTKKKYADSVLQFGELEFPGYNLRTRTRP